MQSQSPNFVLIMAELSDQIHEEISLLSERGDNLAEAGNFKAAIKNYHQALALLPEPKQDWEATLWLYAAIGDAQFLAGDFATARQTFDAAITLPEAIGNPFIHLRLGQASLELGDEDRALEELTRAYASGGDEVFEEDDPHYFAWLNERVELEK